MLVTFFMQVAKTPSPGSPTQTQEVDKLKQQLSTKHTELEQVKQSLKEAVEMNEQQLQMTEQKDQEFVKLKLDIQQTIADKDKTIKEQKYKLKGEHVLVFVKWLSFGLSEDVL